jgi:DNA-binding transcriptional regulator YdaS (Cro superfamily)
MALLKRARVVLCLHLLTAEIYKCRVRPVEPILQVVDRFGGVDGAVQALGVSRATVYFWLKGREPEPKTCVVIERLAGVRRWLLRPSDWHLIWPELVGAEGAPPPAVECKPS